MPRRCRPFQYTVFFLVFLALPLRANLGDTVAQCVARYGKPLSFSEPGGKSPFGTLIFEATGYALIVFLLNNVEVGARVSRVDKAAFTEPEMRNIMASDSTSSLSWTPTTSDDPTCLEWLRPDKATALYDKQKHMLIFTSPEMATALKPTP
jgi:hypothetical protein